MLHEHGADKEEIAAFLSLSSPFYTQLGLYYDLLVEAWLSDHREW